jgi:uncharacterized protein (TIGR02391 family)
MITNMNSLNGHSLVIVVALITLLETETDRSEQRGMMFLYVGAMLALRNPRAHALIQDDPEQALEYLGLLSMLVKALDRAERT